MKVKKKYTEEELVKLAEEAVEAEKAEAEKNGDASDIGASSEAESGEEKAENTVEIDGEETEAPEVPEDGVISAADENRLLREELERLRGRLADIEKENSRMIAEVGEFSELFPEVTIDAIPSEVWMSVRGGVPLAAAYALYEKKCRTHSELVDSVNQRNNERSTGALRGEGDSQFYSPSEVKKMSPSEIKAKYNIIIESMKKWN